MEEETLIRALELLSMAVLLIGALLCYRRSNKLSGLILRLRRERKQMIRDQQNLAAELEEVRMQVRIWKEQHPS